MKGPNAKALREYSERLDELYAAMERGEDTEAMAAEVKKFMIEHGIANEAPLLDDDENEDVLTSDSSPAETEPRETPFDQPPAT